MNLTSFTYTDKGPRTENQDSIGIKLFEDFSMYCVADGVGGSNCGQLASQKSISFLIDQLIAGRYDLKQLLIDTNQNLRTLQKTNSECAGMATTLTGCIVNKRKLNGFHVGDSRLCLLRGNGIKQLTNDHTEVFRLFKAGKIAKEEINSYVRKHVLESAIGVADKFAFQTIKFNLESGDRILLTTDGVHEVISKQEFRDLSIRSQNIDEFGNSIVELLRTRKLTDNISFIAISV